MLATYSAETIKAGKKTILSGFFVCSKRTKRWEKERNTGVEPASQAWEARALPMC